MKAAVLEKIGASTKFKIKELPSPSIGPGQLLVRNYASSVNPVDLILLRGKSILTAAGISNQCLGNDFCGKVIASKSRLFKAGDEVFGMVPVLKGGMYAEEVAVEDRYAMLKPANFTYEEAGVVPLVGLTAYQGLFTLGRLKSQDNVLIIGCTGGVGSAAVQLARNVDAHITGVCSEKHRLYANSIGCDVVVDYRRQKVPSGAKFDLIFDAAGKYTISQLQHYLSDKGLFVSTRGEVDNLKGMVKTTVDLLLENRMKLVMVKPNAKHLHHLQLKMEQGQLRLPVAHTFSLGQLDEAHDMMRKGGFVGKIGIKISLT